MVRPGVAAGGLPGPQQAAHLINAFGLVSLVTVRSRSISGVDLTRARRLETSPEYSL
jgi:hypothetical protein